MEINSETSVGVETAQFCLAAMEFADPLTYLTAALAAIVNAWGDPLQKRTESVRGLHC